MPVEYLTGRVDFAGLSLGVGPEVLIPRVETEELVDLAFDFLKQSQEKSLQVLEIATGSGAISLALVKKILDLAYLNKKWQFLATDISAQALALAKKNYQSLLLEKVKPQKLTLNFLLSDLFDQIKTGQQFDLIIANLPYIPHHLMAKLDQSVKDFEPQLALDGGPTGFELIRKMLQELLAGNFLTKNTLILLEVDQSHDLHFINQHCPDLLNLFKIKAIRDQFDRQRFLGLKAL